MSKPRCRMQRFHMDPRQVPMPVFTPSTLEDWQAVWDAMQHIRTPRWRYFELMKRYFGTTRVSQIDHEAIPQFIQFLELYTSLYDREPPTWMGPRPQGRVKERADATDDRTPPNQADSRTAKAEDDAR